MEFWGIEIKPGKPLMVEPEDGYIIHVSQVALGESKKLKEYENVPIFVKVGDDKTKLAIGTLSQKFPQVSLDLFFDQEFELSHNSKSSVYLLGYKTPDVSDNLDEEIDSDSEIDEFMGQQCGLMPPLRRNDGMINPGESDSDEEQDGSDSDEEQDGSDSDEEQDGSDSDEMGSDEDDEAPMKVVPLSKKRPNGEAMNNTVASKKAKVAIKNKSSGGKKKKCPFPCGSSCKN